MCQNEQALGTKTNSPLYKWQVSDRIVSVYVTYIVHLVHINKVPVN